MTPRISTCEPRHRPYAYERRGWFGSTTGLGGRRKFGGALAEGWEGVSESPILPLRSGQAFSQMREKWDTRPPAENKPFHAEQFHDLGIY